MFDRVATKARHTHLLHCRVDVEVHERAELSLRPEVQLGVPALLVDAEFKLDFAVVRVSELRDGDDVLGDCREFLARCFRDFGQNEDDERMRRVGFVDAVNQDP